MIQDFGLLENGIGGGEAADDPSPAVILFGGGEGADFLDIIPESPEAASPSVESPPM